MPDCKCSGEEFRLKQKFQVADIHQLPKLVEILHLYFGVKLNAVL